MDLAPNWEYVADTVMGGVSQGSAVQAVIAGRTATHLTGAVSLDNNGGFVQIAFDLADGGKFDASAYTGIAFDVFGNEQTYDLRVRTDALTRPWQSFRAEFKAPAAWTTVRVPFADLIPHRTEATFEPERLRRIGILAVGREMRVDLAVASVSFYR
ncbi:CIA30 family protein [uncultured Tateyamaria sp.]|uniref:CIA30 family protein n=1 Tax=uncultured Tateyamaria sp. TaxID=455651 RepID=UPI002613B1F7|nr:CIA30 family protein [uncultured Tateyamaria sp.]